MTDKKMHICNKIKSSIIGKDLLPCQQILATAYETFAIHKMGLIIEDQI